MLRELVLVRHAKSDWGDPSLPDHDRPLNARGNRDAPMMAERFAGAGHKIDLILASTATRARRTAEAFAAALGLEVTLDPQLYLASAEELLARAEAQANTAGASSVILVAHNPGITDLASRLSRGSIGHMPTCAVARFVWAVTEAASPDTTGMNQQSTGLPTEWYFDSPR